MTHGIRASYIAGCRCLPCKVANARYITEYRQQRRAGVVLWGAKISAATAKRLLDQLVRDGVTKATIAHGLGLRSPSLKVHARITVRKALRIKRLHRQYMSEAHD